MKNIKYFKYKNTYSFEKFLKEYGYSISDAVGFSVNYKGCYHGNILKEYAIGLSDHNHIYFRVVYFKSLNEYDQSRLGFNGDRLLSGCNSSNVIHYKVKDVGGLNDRYVIAM